MTAEMDSPSPSLFHRAIAMTGTALCVWAHAPPNEPLENARKLAESVNCPTGTAHQMVECLRTVDAMEIVKSDVAFMKWDFDPMIPFKPTVEPDLPGAFLTKHPVQIIQGGLINPVPLITGITKEDGALRAAAILNRADLLSDLNRDFDRLIPLSLMYDKTAGNVANVTARIRKFYFAQQVTRSSLVDLYTDAWFLNCADATVELHRAHASPVYLYLFAHRGQNSFTEIFGGGSTDYGVCHADDLQYLFPVGDRLFAAQPPNATDLEMVKMFAGAFANFARTGDPTPSQAPKWFPVTSDASEYYRFDLKSPGMESGLFAKRAQFWRSLDWMARPPKSAPIRDEL